MSDFELEKLDIDIDGEFWTDFVQEAFEHVEEIETNVIELEQNPENMEIIHTMFRAFHTIKGLSGFVEHVIIQEVAHRTETMMDLCRKQELAVNKDIVDAILRSSDFIRQLCENIDSAKDSDYLKQISEHLGVLERISSKKEVKIQKQIEVEPEIVSEEHSIEKEETTAIVEENKEKVPKEEKPKKTSKSSKSASKKKEKTVEPKKEVKNENPKEQKVKESIKPEEPKPAKPQVQQNPTNPQKPTVQIEEHMKVANSKIDNLVELIGELIINQALLEEKIISKYSQDNELISELSSFLRITRDLQHLSTSLRLVSFKPTFQKLSRIARDTIHELKKDIEFTVSGESTEIDRSVTDKLLEPLVHLLKNAISHGIEENPEERTQNNKSQKGKVQLNAFSKRGKIYIQIIDDGKGINPEIIYKKALEKELIDPNKKYTDDEIREFILLPGFSTAAKVDNISGRGVGMDVVKTQIQRLGGKVDIKSELGKGSTFTLEVPVNHAIMNGTIIQIEAEKFIVPTVNVKEILQPNDEQWVITQNKRTMIKVRDSIIPIVPLSSIFDSNNSFEKPKLVALLELDQELRALPITNVINRQEVVVKPIGQEFSDLRYISGMSILGNGQVSLILDIDYLFKKEVTQ